ncbi:hypothetical protein DICPUDRAFT_156358 [Dictyostelium purpureum]|uniref:Uncharacterized protein n=1 Tax=Dictyostelium purpureum TaxID=5786 RepID=F0ZWD3_DICPU|nr:uncharacterized protein DICPUDRAFT_156358 [Dictyostelium purpureum]EGC31752.1 hypothetical protein DICPUDRAFT_156358 [Dictyostelium purpureum]|eukprot:XP_003291732.1 hypothetical protein DICPUDRAFT_156358 [Dictyostelium purpureum]
MVIENVFVFSRDLVVSVVFGRVAFKSNRMLITSIIHFKFTNKLSRKEHGCNSEDEEIEEDTHFSRYNLGC